MYHGWIQICSYKTDVSLCVLFIVGMCHVHWDAHMKETSYQLKWQK